MKLSTYYTHWENPLRLIFSDFTHLRTLRLYICSYTKDPVWELSQ